MKFNEMKLKLNDSVKEISFNGFTVKVKQYLPFASKYSIITSSLESSVDENGIYNDCKLNMFLYLQIAFNYTDLEFTDEEKEKALEIFDIISSNGLLDAIISAIPSSEYSYLCDMLEILEGKYSKRALSAIGLFDELPKILETLSEASKDFDISNLKEIQNVAKSLGKK